LVLSTSSSTYNYLAKAAVSSKTGDVLVVWAEYKSSTDCRIWTVLCKPSASEGYSVCKQKRVSARSIYNTHPQVTYHPDLDEFLVGWLAMDEDIEEVHKQWTCFQRMSAQGKPLGSRIVQKFSGGQNGPLKIFDIPQTDASPGGLGAYYLLVLNQYPLDWKDREKTGVYTGNPGADGKLLSKVQRIQQGQWEDDTKGSTGSYWYYGILPYDGCISQDGKYREALITPQSGGSRRRNTSHHGSWRGTKRQRFTTASSPSP